MKYENGEEIRPGDILEHRSRLWVVTEARPEYIGGDRWPWPSDGNFIARCMGGAETMEGAVFIERAGGPRTWAGRLLRSLPVVAPAGILLLAAICCTGIAAEQNRQAEERQSVCEARGLDVAYVGSYDGGKIVACSSPEDEQAAQVRAVCEARGLRVASTEARPWGVVVVCKH